MLSENEIKPEKVLFCKKRKVEMKTDVATVEIEAINIQQRGAEDRHLILRNFQSKYSLFFVLDGHGNCQVVKKDKHVVNLVLQLLVKQVGILMSKENPDIEQGLIDIFIDIDKFLYEKKDEYSGGSTCNLILFDKQTRVLYNANLGDSKCIIFDDNSNVLFESADHDYLTDNKRVDSNLYELVYNGLYVRIKDTGNSLCVARSFGDFPFKQTSYNDYDPEHGCVSVIPTITRIPLNKLDCYHFCLSTDAPFDRLCKMNVIKFLEQKSVFADEPLHVQCQKMAAIVQKKTNDDITILFGRIETNIKPTEQMTLFSD